MKWRLPLEAINKASAREKSIRHGHPSTLHLWWARRPLAAARAVIFGQMVDDPAGYVDVLLSDPGKKRAAERELRKRLAEHFNDATALPEPTLEEVIAEQERERLFAILEDLVLWENTTNEEVLERARAEIWNSWRRTCAENADHRQARELFNRNKLPGFHDPFAGGGALPLEAQRLGLESYASDLNPVAVLINKAMIEIPPKFSGKPPVNPQSREDQGQTPRVFARDWKGAQGLAEDIRYYGQWMRDEAEKRIGHLYPKVEITPAMVLGRPDLKTYQGLKLTVIAWIWARTVPSPDPAFAGVHVPITSSFLLSSKSGNEAWIEPTVDKTAKTIRYHIRKGGTKEEIATAKAGTKIGRAVFRCLFSNAPISGDYADKAASKGQMGQVLMAIVAEGKGGRLYIPAESVEQLERVEDAATTATLMDMTHLEVPCRGTFASNAQGRRYGFNVFKDYFTNRQLVALNTFSDLVAEVRERVQHDAVAAGMAVDDVPLEAGGTGATAYSEALGMYLALAVDRTADSSSSVARWQSTGDKVAGTFARQAIPMMWNYAEVNIFSNSTQNWMAQIAWVAKAVETLPKNGHNGRGFQADAASSPQATRFLPQRGSHLVTSTDPPYYDNVAFADLSDFFYVWLRRSLQSVFPDLFSTMAVPKAEELVAMPYRHGSKEQAEAFFLDGMTRAIKRLAMQTHPGFPVTIYYAFKQSESRGAEGTTSTGWETFLDAVGRAGFAISGTWPIRTERGARSNALASNALSSSIVLVCRPRVKEGPIASRREFITALRSDLPKALLQLQRGNIAPVDLAQAAIGPGMAVYTSFGKILDADGRQLSVRDALALINQTLDEMLAEQEGDFDSDSRWALAWFEQHGFDWGDFGVAETLSKAKNTSVDGMVEAGILESKGGKVRLLRPNELPGDWDPATDPRLTAWEMVHHLIRILEVGGEYAAAECAAQLGTRAETARELCYTLYTLCERKRRAAEALAYNGMVQSWPEISRLAREEQSRGVDQTSLFASEEG